MRSVLAIALFAAVIIAKLITSWLMSTKIIMISSNIRNSRNFHRIHAFIESLPKHVREELKSLKVHHPYHNSDFTEEEKAAFQKHFEEKLEKLSSEAKKAAKKIHEIRVAHKDDLSAAKAAIDKELKSLPEKVREELESFHLVTAAHPTYYVGSTHPIVHRAERHSTTKAH
ncbi:hypothetical protein PRIPAC_75414 [Pristionchus pacificus]|uniref:Uncharacterized protein n=1 Tax=Pristionchus pacificus TaxID=54126 RepID=A0A2A6B527_PRIPA|nr:hypothetical protein PRIPAC_75414 [Pristionchus pacificus]|eukprot:PDM60961.1 hypothetical protein PRIPAC_54767 [Pristionchus pacificus]